MDPTELLKQAWSNGEWYAISSAIVIIVVRLFRKPFVQNLLQKPYRWKSWPKWLRQIVIFIMSLANSLGVAYMNGGNWKQALLASLPVALASILGHKTTKLVGQEITYQQIVNTKKPGQVFKPYKPGVTRKALDLVFPIDHKTINNINIDNLSSK